MGLHSTWGLIKPPSGTTRGHGNEGIYKGRLKIRIKGGETLEAVFLRRGTIIKGGTKGRRNFKT